MTAGLVVGRAAGMVIHSYKREREREKELDTCLICLSCYKSVCPSHMS